MFHCDTVRYTHLSKHTAASTLRSAQLQSWGFDQDLTLQVELSRAVAERTLINERRLLFRHTRARRARIQVRDGVRGRHTLTS